MTEQQARCEVKCHVCGRVGVEVTVRDEIITLHCPMCGDYITQHRCAMLPLPKEQNELKGLPDDWFRFTDPKESEYVVCEEILGDRYPFVIVKTMTVSEADEWVKKYATPEEKETWNKILCGSADDTEIHKLSDEEIDDLYRKTSG